MSGRPIVSGGKEINIFIKVRDLWGLVLEYNAVFHRVVNFRTEKSCFIKRGGLIWNGK